MQTMTIKTKELLDIKPKNLTDNEALDKAFGAIIQSVAYLEERMNKFEERLCEVEGRVWLEQ